MRTAYSRSLAHHLFKSLLLFFVFSLPGVVFGQLTHVEAVFSVDSNMVSLDDSTTIQVAELVTAITPNDSDDFGSISVIVYDSLDLSNPLVEIVKTKAGLISEGIISDGIVTFKLLPLQEGRNYKILYYPQTLTGAFGQELILYYPNQQ